MEHFDPTSDTLNHLQTVLACETQQDKFACHGTVPVFVHPLHQTHTPSSADSSPSAGKINISLVDHGNVTQVSLPPSTQDDHYKLQSLVDEACNTSQQTMYDDIFQQRGIVTADRFMTDFCPYKAGIIDTVTQHLLPPMSDGSSEAKSKKDEWNRNLAEWMDQHAHLLRPDAQNKIGEEIHNVVGWSMNIANGYFPLDQVFECMNKIGVGPPAPLKPKKSIPQKSKPQTEDDIARENITASFTEFVGSGKATQVRQWEVFAVAAQRSVNQSVSRISTLITNSKKPLVPRGIQADLATLTVHSGPSGMFKPHVDYPRSDAHLGTLIVVLPVPFQGGGLAVRHNGCEIVHQSQTTHQPEIHWAAFYGGCEYEVLPVQAGHRISLTYDLYLAPASCATLIPNVSLSSIHSHLTRHLRQAFMLPAFMSDGGYFGFYLAHLYPNGQFNPRLLKGSDLLIYEAILINHLAVASLVIPHGSQGQLTHEQLKHICRTLNEQHFQKSSAANARTPYAPQDHDSDLEILVEEEWNERQGQVPAEEQLQRVARNVRTAENHRLTEERAAKRRKINVQRAQTIFWVNDLNQILSGSNNACPEGYFRLALIAKVPASRSTSINP